MSEAAISDSRRMPGMLGATAWAAFVVVGWVVFAYIALGTEGGLAGAWAAMLALPLYVQLLMWALLLPWVVALWVTQTGWPEWLRAALVIGLCLASIALSLPQARLKGAVRR